MDKNVLTASEIEEFLLNAEDTLAKFALSLPFEIQSIIPAGISAANVRDLARRLTQREQSELVSLWNQMVKSLADHEYARNFSSIYSERPAQFRNPYEASGVAAFTRFAMLLLGCISPVLGYFAGGGLGFGVGLLLLFAIATFFGLLDIRFRIEELNAAGHRRFFEERVFRAEERRYSTLGYRLGKDLCFLNEASPWPLRLPLPAIY